MKETILGLLIPFAGTTAGAACVLQNRSAAGGGWSLDARRFAGSRSAAGGG